MTDIDRAAPFSTAEALGEWLAQHHDHRDELWVRIYRKGAGVPSVTWDDCVVQALRFGWIDGLRRSLDTVSYLQRLTSRKRDSGWSVRNREHAMRLIEDGLMEPAGMAQVDAARADGRWEAAYAGSATMTLPADFVTALETRPVAKAFFATLNRANHYAIYYRLHTAKRPGTRANRLTRILDQLDREERFH